MWVLSLDLTVPQMVSEVRLVPVWVALGAPGRGGVGIVGHGDPGVVLVPRVGIGQERGRGVAVTGVGPLVPVGIATPYRRGLVVVPRVVLASRGCVRATRTRTTLVLGFRLPVLIGDSDEVHFFFRVMLAPVLVSWSSTVGFGSRVLPIGVRGPWGVGLLLGLRPRYLPTPGNVMPGQLHALVVIDGLDAHNGEFRRVIKLRIRDGREPRSELVAEDASQQPHIHLLRREVVQFLPPHPGCLGKRLGVHFLGGVPFLLGRPRRLIAGFRIGRRGGGVFRDLLDWGPAAKEGTQNLSDTGQPRRMVVDRLA